jgi:hypothetical protein
MSSGDRMTKGLDFMLKGIGPKDKTPESEGELQESRVMTPESGKESPGKDNLLQDPGILNQESRVESQDTGIVHQDPGILSQESRVMTPESLIIASEEKGVRQEPSVGLRESRVANQESGVVTDDIIEQAVTQALKSPKISLYSPLLLAVLENQQLMLLNRREATLLQYRKSTKARELVENALKEAYPELCEKILKRINEGNGEK